MTFELSERETLHKYKGRALDQIQQASPQANKHQLHRLELEQCLNRRWKPVFSMPLCSCTVSATFQLCGSATECQLLFWFTLIRATYAFKVNQMDARSIGSDIIDTSTCPAGGLAAFSYRIIARPTIVDSTRIKPDLEKLSNGIFVDPRPRWP